MDPGVLRHRLQISAAFCGREREMRAPLVLVVPAKSTGTDIFLKGGGNAG